ncbi:hypothetical protein AGMMS49975_10040 [Clostridia bacterium]|nr:hypothetical protein AGMMS49975_10040 [Clostridia bacterium]
MRLNIYDASWLLHYGASSVKYKDYSYCGYPMGGIKYLCKHLVFDLFKENPFVVCFDSKTDKSSILPGYKGNRSHEAHIVSQSQFAYNMLMKCGISCMRQDGYEADDLAASAVARFRRDYSEIVIVSNDHDLAHNVFQHVRVEATSAGGADISANNFVMAANKSPVIFNTISAFKVFTGDASDGIPGFRSEGGKSGKKLYSDFVRYGEEVIPNKDTKPFNFSRRDFLEYFLETLDYLTEKDREGLAQRIAVIFPRISKDVPAPTEIDNVDIPQLQKLLSVLNDDVELQRLKLPKIRLSESELNDFKASAAVLRNSTFAVDNDCPVHPTFLFEDEAVNLRVF